MSEIANSEGASETEKPVQNEVKFPPFPDPTDNDFDEDISEEERTYYKNKFKDLSTVKSHRLHCTACDRHLGCSARNERIRAHPMLRTLVCHTCHTFYNSGEFEKGDDGSELYCRWCGQGGQVYCCSDCPHVFCAKCIKRNLGAPKIKEIENADDWKCFKCNSECLMDLRAVCWAVLRYCDLKNKVTYLTEDPELKAAYQKECALDLSECCKRRRSQKIKEEKDTSIKKKDIKKESDSKTATTLISKIPSTIQVKKFASINLDDIGKQEKKKIASVNLDDIGKQEKKAQKRSASPKQKSILVKNPISLAPCYPPRMLTPVTGHPVPSLPKKIRLPNCNINTPVRFPPQERKMTYARLRPKLGPQLPIPIMNNCFNGYAPNVFHCANPVNDNINLSLESLTQGLDMSAVAALSNNSHIQDDDVVCTPDFPLEPLCEVTEDNDDDVQCITPGPVAAPKVVTNPPPLVPRTAPNIPEVCSENIIQMTENDVTVNESTGGLKFRVDPQTLSSNKMYRLPDGRIFAINANSNMPGGYSATIVAVTDASKGVPKGATFAAKLSSVTTSTPTPKNRNQVTRIVNTKRVTKISKPPKVSETASRECDLKVPVEWYRYNLVDAVDALEYSLSRLHKLKKEATTMYLRTRSATEMRNLHRALERLLNTSSTRFNEIRDNLNKGLKQYLLKKSGLASSDEDDDVEILPDMDDDPIFIDENSVESNMNGNENQEVDLTGPGSSEYNDSGENRSNKRDDPLNISEDFENGDSGELPIVISNKNTAQENKKVGDEDVEDPHRDNDIVTLSNDDLNEVSSADDINGVIEESLNNGDTTSKNEGEENDLAQASPSNKADNQVSDEKNEDSGDQLLNSDDKDLDKSDVKMQDVDDETKNLDDKIEGPDDKIESSDDKMEVSDDKIEGSDDKMEGSDDKMKDSGDKIEGSDDKIAGSDSKIESSDDKKEASDDKTQDTEDKNQDAEDIKPDDEDSKQDDEDDKMQDSEISEEMIETLLKDDNSRDSASTNTEVPKALQVT